MSKPQFLQTPLGEELVVLSREDYDALVAAAHDDDAEDDEDVALYVAAKADLAGSQPLPAAVSAAVLKGDGLLKAFRKHRGLTQVQLAEQANISQGFLSDLEARDKVKRASRGTIEDLARVLEIEPDLLSALQE